MSQVDGNACIPLEGVLVDVWHCDARGRLLRRRQGEVGHDYLRGYQHTDANGKAAITTIYPGWYQGRAVHIHFKIRTDRGGVERLRVHVAAVLRRRLQRRRSTATGVYASKGTPDQPNASDGIFQQSQGMTLLNVVKDGDGYKATFEIAVQTT